MACENPPDCAPTWRVSFLPSGPTAYDPYSLGEWALSLWQDFGLNINAEYGVEFGWWGSADPPQRTFDPVDLAPPAPINPVQPVDVPAERYPRVPSEEPEAATRRPSLPGSPGKAVSRAPGVTDIFLGISE